MRARRGDARAGLVPMLCWLLLSATAAAPAAGAAPTTPPGCTPVAIQSLRDGVAACVDRVLVTETTNSQEQNHSSFTVTDHSQTLTATVPNWWPSGPPSAGMVATLWGVLDRGVFKLTRWIETSHGSGPAPDGPYPRARALDVASGRIPEHRMVWVAAKAFLLDPQNGGDGDIHVQTNTDCPAAGVTTENTPPLRGYVDHPALPGVSGSTDTSDAPSNHLADAPPVGVPVMILGATRYDYGFGWWELHPIRAWRFLTPGEYSQMAADCAADPMPHLDSSGPAPAPFGVPPCTDGSEVGNPGSVFSPCGAQCYVTHTAIGQVEQLSSSCASITALPTPSQEAQLGAASSTPSSPPANPPDDGQKAGAAVPSGSPGSVGDLGSGSSGSTGSTGSTQHSAAAVFRMALTRTYGTICGALRRGPRGAAHHALGVCVQAMARLAGGERISAAAACRSESRRLPGRGPGSYYSLCRRSAARLLAGLRGHRIREFD